RAFQHEHDARVLVWILNHPSKQPHQVVEFFLVAAADDLPNVAQKSAQFPSALSRDHAEPEPQVELVWLSCPAGLEDECTLETLGTLPPEFFSGYSSLRAVRGVPDDGDILDFELKLFRRNKRC